jgi:hypothetical protein
MTSVKAAAGSLFLFLAIVASGVPYGAYVVNDVTGANDCPLCNNGDILTGSICTCPAQATSLQNFRIINDCGAAAKDPFRGAFITLCDAPDNSSSWGGGFQLGMGGACRYGNPKTQNCSCPSGFTPQVNSAIVDGLESSSIIFCYRGLAAKSAMFGGSFQMTDEQACLAGNPFVLGSPCACPPGFSVNPIRVLSTPQQGSFINFCFPPVGPPPPAPGAVFQLSIYNTMINPRCGYNADKIYNAVNGQCVKSSHSDLPSVAFFCVNGEVAMYEYEDRVDPYCEGPPVAIYYMPNGQCIFNAYLPYLSGLGPSDNAVVAPFCN